MQCTLVQRLVSCGHWLLESILCKPSVNKAPFRSQHAVLPPPFFVPRTCTQLTAQCSAWARPRQAPVRRWAPCPAGIYCQSRVPRGQGHPSGTGAWCWASAPGAASSGASRPSSARSWRGRAWQCPPVPRVDSVPGTVQWAHTGTQLGLLL